MNTILDEADAKKKKIKLCCTWGDQLDDGILNYIITDGGSKLKKIVKNSVNEWEDKIPGLKFQDVDDRSDADIFFEFKKGKGKKVGKTVTNFDHEGFIRIVEISLSKNSYGDRLDHYTLEHISLHEIGHALGIGHANFGSTLMSPEVNQVIKKISKCEIDAVMKANEWKLIKDKNSPSQSDKKSQKCK
ncbi:MAG: matrixin family metalloprotease [Nitrososphaeraceae archaeon]|nr:matrixin family metalloprotease [Nitrososphaeraceae archaeon]